MASEPLLDVGDGKLPEERLIDIPSGVTGGLASWMAQPPARLTTLESVPGELAPPGPAVVRNHVDVPVQPGSDR